jgi:WD40 repeat protein
MGHAESVNCIVFSPDGETIASAGNDRIIRLWNAHTGELLKTLTGHIENVNTIAFSPDGNTIASGSGRLVYLGGGEDQGTCVGQEIRLWNPNTGEPIKTLIGHTSVVNSVAFSPNGNTIASGSGHWMGYEGTYSAGEEIRLWNVDTGELLKTLTGHKNVVSSVAFSPDGNLIVSGDWWYHWVNGHLSSGAVGGEIRVWDAHTGELLKTLTGHTGEVSSVAFSPDGKTLASGRTDGTILLWDFSSPP